VDLVQFIVPAAAAFVVASIICWLMWRWRQHAVPNEEWARLERRRRLLEGENLRLQDRVELLGQQNQEFPSLRAAISDRDDQILELEHNVGIAQAREIGIATRLDQFSADLNDATLRERELEAEVLRLRDANAASEQQIAELRATGLQASLPPPPPASLQPAISRPNDLSRIAELEEQVALAEARAIQAEAEASELAARAAEAKPAGFGLPLIAEESLPAGSEETSAEHADADERIAVLETRLRDAQASAREATLREAVLTAEVAEARERVDKMVIDLRNHASSDAEIDRLSSVASGREAEIKDLQLKIRKLASRADASAVLSAELRSRLDNQLVANGNLEQQLHSQS